MIVYVSHFVCMGYQGNCRFAAAVLIVAGSCREAVIAANRDLIQGLQAASERAILCPVCWMVLQKEGEECNHIQ